MPFTAFFLLTWGVYPKPVPLYILEAYNPVSYTDSQLEINLLKDKPYFKSHPHLI